MSRRRTARRGLARVLRGLCGPAFAVLALLAPAPAPAVIEGSPHDLLAQGYDFTEESPQRERCRLCHLPTASAWQGLVPDVPPVLTSSYDAASIVCFSCHDGTTIVSPNVDASRSAYHPGSHGNDLRGREDLRSDALELPHLGGARMACTTCHDPHDNTQRPFLRIGINDLCLRCHSKLAEYGQGAENRTGSHRLAEDPLKVSRDDVPMTVGQPFRIGFPAPYPLMGGRGDGSWHWTLGGHLDQGAAGAMGCQTCHAVHGNETAGPAVNLLATDPVGDVADLFCEGCHAGERGDGKAVPPHPNPGGTTTGRTYHPTDDDEANGAGRLLEIREPPGWPFGGGTPARLLCTTCHRAHHAWVETPLLRPPTLGTGFCEECHDQVPEYHHKSGELTDSRCAPLVPVTRDAPGGQLVCASCHRAHNAGFGEARESDYVPLLISPMATGKLCESCHPPTNPTCSQNAEYRASHFIGDPTLTDTYLDENPPLRLEKWPDSGLKGVYGGDRGLVVGCLSCHSFRQGAVVSGDDGTAPHLLAMSGNRQEWQPGEEIRYLCTGCHGVQPGTGAGQKGNTHPLMDADIARLGHDPVLPVSATPGGKMNCDSCHRPHDAQTKGGRYILEVVDGENADPLAIRPKIDFTIVCRRCHDKY